MAFSKGHHKCKQHDVSGVCQYKTKNTDMSPTSLKRKGKKRKRKSSSKPKHSTRNEMQKHMHENYKHEKLKNIKQY